MQLGKEVTWKHWNEILVIQWTLLFPLELFRNLESTLAHDHRRGTTAPDPGTFSYLPHDADIAANDTHH